MPRKICEREENRREEQNSVCSFSWKFRKISRKMCIKLVRGSFWKKIEERFRALSSPTGMPNITPIRSEMKAPQLFFVFLHGALWKRSISSEKDEQWSRIITPSHSYLAGIRRRIGGNIGTDYCLRSQQWRRTMTDRLQRAPNTNFCSIFNRFRDIEALCVLRVFYTESTFPIIHSYSG